jgi:hypothetical protein
MSTMMRKIFVIVLILFSPCVLAVKGGGNKIVVQVCSLLPAKSVEKLLDPSKYTVEILKVPDSVKAKSVCEAIWVGIDVPLSNARKAIMSATASGITLNYIGIAGDYDYKEPPAIINRTITIGGSTKAAIEQGLRKLTPKELRDILSVKNDEEFHKMIRSTYSMISKRYWMHKLRN